MTIEQALQQLLGPFGLTVALVFAVVYLARELFKFVRAYIQDLKDQLKIALEGWQEQTRASQTLADAQAARNRDDEMRRRLADEKGGAGK